MGRDDAIGLIAAALLLGAAPAWSQPSLISDAERAEGFVPLFDGETLEGWDGDPALWSVRDGAIVGSSDGREVTTNTFLIYEEPFSDFVLRLQVRLRNGNGGIQFRSRHIDGPGWIVHGYQADFSDAGERSAWGNFYEEKGRGRGLMAVPDQGWQRAKSVVRHREWNDYEILAQGDRVRLTLNDRVTIDGADGASDSGVIAIQLHSGPAMQVECRNIRIKPL